MDKREIGEAAETKEGCEVRPCRMPGQNERCFLVYEARIGESSSRLTSPDLTERSLEVEELSIDVSGRVGPVPENDAVVAFQYEPHGENSIQKGRSRTPCPAMNKRDDGRARTRRVGVYIKFSHGMGARWRPCSVGLVEPPSDVG